MAETNHMHDSGSNRTTNVDDFARTFSQAASGSSLDDLTAHVDQPSIEPQHRERAKALVVGEGVQRGLSFSIPVPDSVQEGWWVCQCFDLPGVIGRGPTAEFAVQTARELAVELVVRKLATGKSEADVLAAREAGKRTKSITIKLTPAEANQVKLSARDAGQTESDYARQKLFA